MFLIESCCWFSRSCREVMYCEVQDPAHADRHQLVAIPLLHLVRANITSAQQCVEKTKGANSRIVPCSVSGSERSLPVPWRNVGRSVSRDPLEATAIG
jgi:hypothetical protein